MDLIPGTITCRSRQIENRYVVWLSGVNRYLVLEEPAFRVIDSYLSGSDKKELEKACAGDYGIPEEEATLFVSEMVETLTRLFNETAAPHDPEVPYDHEFKEKNYPCVRFLEVAGQIIEFRFENRAFEERIFPLYAHHESGARSTLADLIFELGKHGERLTMAINREKAYAWSPQDFHKLKGALSMQILNCIYRTTNDHWMGVVHASSVSLNNRSLLLPGQPGSGKSTLASLLMAAGCQLISDDFTPLSTGKCRSYPYPARISVKPGSIDLLSDHFPQLRDAGSNLARTSHDEATFLTPRQPEFHLTPGFQVAAIVFTDYNPAAGSELTRIPNLQAINSLFDETWLAPGTEAAETFLDWFFTVPCYKIEFGQSDAAVRMLLKLLDHEP